MRLTLLGVGAMASPRYRPAGLLVTAGDARVMLDGGPGSEPRGQLGAWLVCDESGELQPELRRLAGRIGCRPAVASFAAGGLSLDPLPVDHTSHPTFGYLVRANARRVVWAPEFLRFPDWAAGADLMFAEAAGWDRPIRFARGAGGHAAAVDVAVTARAAGIRRLVLAHVGRPTIRAVEGGLQPPFGELGVEGRAYLVARRRGVAAAASGAAGHEALPHTADAGIRAWAPGLAAVFSEAGRGLAELAADVDTDAPPGEDLPVELEATDLPALAYCWLNELVSVADARGVAIAAIRRAQVGLVRSAEPGAGWRLNAVVTIVPLEGRRVRRRLDIKSATYHGLRVAEGRDGWTLEAYVDV